MKSLFFLAGFAASVNALALFGRAEVACCFHLNVSGEITGPLGQLTDGQSRVGDNSLNQSLFCINSTGVITDSTGKGCIITPETTQFQCDEGKSGTPGFSISSSGQLQFHDSDYFIACETGHNGGKNIYTTNSTSVTRCKAVYLNADSCINAGSPPVVGIPPAPGINVTGGGGAGAVAPGSSVAAPTVTVVSTVTVSNCVCPTTAASAAPGAPGAAAAAPSQTSSAPGSATPGASWQTSSAPAGAAPAVVPVTPALGHTSVTSATSGSASAPTSAPASSISTHTSVVPVVPVPGQSSATPASSAFSSESTHTSAASSTHPLTPCPTCSQSAASSTTQASGVSTPCPSFSQSAASSGAHTSSVCPSCSQSTASSTTQASSASSPCPSCSQSASPPVTSTASAPSSVTVPANSTHISSVAVTSVATTPSTSIRPNSTSTSATSTSTTTSCPTDLSGEFQFPHLVVRIDSAEPDTPHGTGLNGTINSTVATTFNFDIPQSYSGKTCNLMFLFPRKEDLQTTSFSFSGDGKVAFGKLSQTISTSTTDNNVPSVSQGLGTITISPGHSYLVSTFSCPAGQAVAFEMKNAGSTDFEFFEDWNPSPLGLFITAC